jgi:hypothetical protein
VHKIQSTQGWLESLTYFLAGVISRIVTGRLEIIDLKEGGVDLFLFARRAQAIVNLGFDDQISLMCLGVDDRYRLVARFTDRTPLFGTEDHHASSPRPKDSTSGILPTSRAIREVGVLTAADPVASADRGHLTLMVEPWIHWGEEKRQS